MRFLKKYRIHIALGIIFILFICNTYFYIQNKSVTIPKIIHYVWIGPNKMPDNFQEVLASWKKYAPDYKINKIDESICNINANAFVSEAYAFGMYNFASDYCRFAVLEKEGGLYLDTDHMLSQSPDKLLKGARRVFTKETQNTLSGSFIAVMPNDPLITKMVNHYNTQLFERTPLPHVLTHYFKETVTPHPDIPFYNENGTRLFPVNIGMIDFGGGDNVAKHLYNNSTAEKHLQGLYYNIFKEKFLNTETIHICDTHNRKQYFILDTPQTGYLFTTNKRGKIILKTSNWLVILWNDPKKLIRYKFNNGCWIKSAKKVKSTQK